MSVLVPGFESPLAAQSCFRAVLAAFSSPGAEMALPVVEAPPGLSPAAASVLLTLADAATNVALPEDAAEWLAFHAGAKVVPVDVADFCATSVRPALASLRQGTDEAPEEGATLILDVPGFAEGRRFRLAGPGLRVPLQRVLPLDEFFAPEWQVQTARAPRGVDVLLCAGHSVLALPRSLRIEEV
jgi:alpha-D-ribose 1-methylphosphonate 5-triphosphate synthase subunit PhnH